MKKIFIYGLLLTLVNSCEFTGSKKDNIAVQIDKYTLSYEEYNYQIEKLKKNTGMDSIQCRAQIMDEAYILAFAQQHRFDTVAALEKRLASAIKFYVSQVDGYLWNKNIKPKLELNEQTLRNAYKRKKQQYQIELLNFENNSILSSQPEIIDRKKFDELKRIIPPDQFYTITLSYPFLPYGAFTDQLDTVQTGDIIGPFLTDQGNYVMRVVSIVPITLPPFTEIQNTIHHELTMMLTQKYIWQSVQNIKSKTHPSYYKSAIAEICRQYDEQNKDWSAQVDDILLMEYSLDKKRIPFKGKDFKEFIRYQPMFIGSLGNEVDVQKMIETYLINQYLYEEALKLNPEKDKEYVLFQNWIRSRFYLNYFKEKYIQPTINIQEAEVDRYYQVHKDRLKTYESANINIYQFKKPNDAILYRQQHRNPNDRSEERIEAHIQQITFQRHDTKGYDPSFIQAIENLKVGELSNLVKFNDQYCLLELKSTSGTMYIPYEQIKEQLKQELYIQKEKNEFNRQVASLKLAASKEI